MAVRFNDVKKTSLKGFRIVVLLNDTGSAGTSIDAITP